MVVGGAACPYQALVHTYIVLWVQTVVSPRFNSVFETGFVRGAEFQAYFSTYSALLSIRTFGYVR